MKLIVGLGNIGKEYNDTRHNIGFKLIDAYASYHGIEIDKKGYKGYYYKGKINGVETILLKPTTYMNLSGESLIDIVNYFKIDIKDILVIYDDFDLEFAKIRIREKGSAGGHNGMISIISHLHTSNIKRVRFGIGESEGNSINHVLGKFSKKELKVIEEKEEKVIALLNDFLVMEDFSKLMSKYN